MSVSVRVPTILRPYTQGASAVSAEGATLFLLGGEPFEDDVVMWWNFVGRSHEEIVEAREMNPHHRRR